MSTRIWPLFLVLAAACGTRAEPQARTTLDPRCDEVDGRQRCTRYDVSIIDLIARPDRYDGRPVRLIGYVNLEFEGNGIYLSREDFEHRISKNGLWVHAPDSLQVPSGFRPRYMIVEGTFDAADEGHLGMWSGAIREVTRMDDWGSVMPPPEPAAGAR